MRHLKSLCCVSLLCMAFLVAFFLFELDYVFGFSQYLDENTIFAVGANYSYLNSSIHMSKLISNFRCNEEHLKLLILATSMASSFKRRESIRLTWGKTLDNQVGNDFRTFFAVGKSKDDEVMQKLNKEAAFYKDIIFGDFFEIFYNLPFKVEAEFEWAYKHCSFDYFLKTDDDVFFNLANLFELLNKKDVPKKKLYLGLRHFYAKALRNHPKYHVSYEEYATKYYPEFCSGGGFIFTSDVVKDIIPFFRKKPFKLDDIYIAMLALNVGVKPMHNDNFKFFEEDCVYHNKYIAYHARNFTSNLSCMQKLFYSMLEDSKNPFNKKHYAR